MIRNYDLESTSRSSRSSWRRAAQCILLVMALPGYSALSFGEQIVVDFEDLLLEPDSSAEADASEAPFVSHQVTFNRTWVHEFDCCPAAFAYSNQTDLSTAGFTNPFSAYALPNGGGVNGSNQFAVAHNSVPGDAVITLPASSTVIGAFVTNTTYTYLAAANGDDGGGNFVKGPFGDGDWFRLKFIGKDSAEDETGAVEFYLADFRDDASYVISDWTWVDLSPLGNSVKTIEFSLDSTDNGPFGMNTPAYFAIDDLTIVTVPEPGNALLALIGAVVSLSVIRRRRFAV